MFCIRSLNHKMKRLHGRCLGIVYNDNYSSYEELLNRDSSFSMHHRNFQFLATEMFSVYIGTASNFSTEEYPLNPESSYSLRNQQTFATRPIHTIHYGSNSLSYVGPKIWKIVPSNVKNLEIKRLKDKLPL